MFKAALCLSRDERWSFSITPLVSPPPLPLAFCALDHNILPEWTEWLNAECVFEDGHVYWLANAVCSTWAALSLCDLDFMWWSIVEGSKSVEGKMRWKLDIFKSKTKFLKLTRVTDQCWNQEAEKNACKQLRYEYLSSTVRNYYARLAARPPHDTAISRVVNPPPTCLCPCVSDS